jgi:hypothetical protein
LGDHDRTNQVLGERHYATSVLWIFDDFMLPVYCDDGQDCRATPAAKNGSWAPFGFQTRFLPTAPEVHRAERR